MASEKGIDQIYLALEKLKDVELSGAAAGSSEVAAVETYFDALIAHVHDPDIKVRNLLASEIPNYLHWFSSEPSMNAMLDLCEDSEPTVRISAVRGLQRFCEKAPSNVGRISDVLGQLLGTEDGAELKAVQAAFAGTIRVDFSSAMVTLVDLITNSETPESLRNRQLSFLKEQLQTIVKEPFFNQSVTHQKTFFAQLRVLFLNASSSLLPLSDAEFLMETVRTVKLSRTEPSTIDQLSSTVLECFEKHLKAKAIPFTELLQYFGAILKKLGATAAKGPSSCTAVLSFFIEHLIPLWTPNAPSELSASLQIFLKMLAYATEKVEDSIAGELLPKFWEFLKLLISRPRPLSTVVHIFELECVLAAVVSLCSKNSAAVKSVLGVFVPTGQPSDFRADLATKKEAFLKLISSLNSEATQQLAVFRKTVNDYKNLMGSSSDSKQKHEIKESINKLHSPIQSLQNIVAFTNLLTKQRPVFSRSDIAMSWISQKRAGQQNQKTESRGQSKKGQPNPSVSRRGSTGSANGASTKNRNITSQDNTNNKSDRKRNRNVVFEIRNDNSSNKGFNKNNPQKRSIKRTRKN